MSGEAWFERRVVNGRIMRGVRPVNWKGAATIVGFILAMAGGGALFLLIGLLTRNVLAGAAVFVSCAVAGGGTFLRAAATRSRLVPVDPSGNPVAPPLAWGGMAAAVSLASAVVTGTLAFVAIDLLTGNTLYAALAFGLFVLLGAVMSLWAASITSNRRAAFEPARP